MTRKAANRSLLLTPPGSGAIGIVRVTGPDAASIIGKLFEPAARRGQPARSSAQTQDPRIETPGPEACGSLLTGERLRYGRIVIEGEDVDDVIVSRASSGSLPEFDISAHGGIRIIEKILEALERYGAPLWDADERRPPIWDVQNLIDIEAAEALSRVKTQRAVRFLAWQRRFLPAHLEQLASLCRTSCDEARTELHSMLARYPAARLLVQGATVVVLGPPNSGKSTLFNSLVGRSVTIVSSRAGTTRDWVAESVEMDGVPVRLVDTAGRRDRPGTDGDGGHQAMESGWAIAEQADVCLLLLDGSEPLSGSALCLFETCRRLPRCLTVITKLDVGRAWDSTSLPSGWADDKDGPIRISALTGDGVGRLTRSISRLLGFDGWVEATPCFFTGRQRDIAAGALSDLPKSPAAAEVSISQRLIGTTPTDTDAE